MNEISKTDKDYELLRLEALKVLPPEQVRLALNVADIGADLVARIQTLERERDLAIKEASRRDQKWIDGINEIIGTKLDFHDPCSRNNASKVLGDLVARIQQLERELATAQIMPGAWQCSKCRFVLQKNVLHTGDGKISADTSPLNEVCPNDGQLMRPLTWRDANEEFYKANLKLSQERDQSRAEGAVMRACLKKFAAKVECGKARSTETYNEAKRALSTTCGQDFMEALKACVVALEWCRHLVDSGKNEKSETIERALDKAKAVLR